MFGAKLSWSRVTWSESPPSASPISQSTPTSPHTRSSSTKPALVVKKFYQQYAKSSPSLVDTSPKNQANRRRKMGQNQTKSADMDVSYSTGPDPTLFHDRPPHSAPILPNTPMRPLDPPHSAPLVPTLTDQSLSRIEYTPGPYSAVPKPQQWNQPTRPVPAHRSFSVKPKNLAKKLSQRREVKSASPPPALDNQMPPTTAKACKTLGEDIRFFDSGVRNVDIRSTPSASPWNPAQMPISTSATMKAATFSAATQKRRLSLSERSTDLPFHPQQGLQPSQYPYSKPTHHRRTSSNSVKSARGSVKSAKRAEREWRAKVAGLANARESARSSYVEVRGPPPPKRSMSGTLNLHATGNLSAQVSAIPNPASSANPPYIDITPDRRRGDTPESESLVTPPSSNVAVALDGPHAAYNTPVGAKSIVSNRSFETLGHYPNPAYSSVTPSNALPITLSPSETPYTSTPASARTGVLGPSKPPTRSRSRRLSTGSQRERLPVSGAPSVSSFYFNPQRASTRPSSLAVSHLLATIPSGDASSLAANNAPADSAQVPGDTPGTGLLVNKPPPPRLTSAGGSQAPHRASLPPFQSFQSPTTSSDPLIIGREKQIDLKLAPRGGSRERRIASEPNIQIDPPSARTDHVKRSSLDSHAPRHDTPKDIASVAKAAVPANSALQPVKNSQKPSLPPTAQADGSVHHARPAHPAILSIGVATPQRTSKIHLRAPATPLSPTTNFLLTAPIESLDWTQHLDSARSPKRDHHPFSSGEQPDFDVGGLVPQGKVDEWGRGYDHGDYDDYDRGNPSYHQIPSTPHGLKDNRPITHSAKQFVYADTEDRDRSFTFPSPPQMGLRTDVLRAQVNRTTYDPFSHPSSNASTTTTPPPLTSTSNSHGNVLHKPRAAKVNERERERERERRPSVLQVRKTQPKASIIGTGAQAAGREREREFEKYQRMGIDLTPGMQDGNRPAKSGLPASDLEKWLKQTSLA